MKKGEQKKGNILNVAEELFCSRGYENTGIQDILDVLHTSKGSFYHHFPSKEAVLIEICRSKATNATAKVMEYQKQNVVGVTLINKILKGFIPIRGTELRFLKMLLPVFDTQEGRTVLICFQEQLKELFLPILDQACTEAVNDKEIYPGYKIELAAICLDLVNVFWKDLVLRIIRDNSTNQTTDISDIIRQINLTSGAIQRILEVPYGSIMLIDIKDLHLLIGELKLQWSMD